MGKGNRSHARPPNLHGTRASPHPGPNRFGSASAEGGVGAGMRGVGIDDVVNRPGFGDFAPKFDPVEWSVCATFWSAVVPPLESPSFRAGEDVKHLLNRRDHFHSVGHSPTFDSSNSRQRSPLLCAYIVDGRQPDGTFPFSLHCTHHDSLSDRLRESPTVGRLSRGGRPSASDQRPRPDPGG